jgi:glycosyltransferase involved in cell wall biosynthesis
VTPSSATAAKTADLPFVSVIVPVLNMPVMIQRCLDALAAQTYPRERYEVIVVDNGSRDNTPDVVRRYPVTLLTESTVRSPYAARNLALRSARGSVIALTDADCAPIPEWLERGVGSLERNGADLVGGEVKFLFSPQKTYAEMFDSIGNLEMKRSIARRGVAKTGNLLVKRAVFDAIGPFQAEIRSGGDVLWTGAATRGGFKLVYDPDMIVRKQARTLKALLKKQYRIGQGHPRVWKAEGRPASRQIRQFVTEALPPSPLGILGLIRDRGTPAMRKHLIQIWTVSWMCGLSSTLGRVRYFLKGVAGETHDAA